MPCHLHPHPHAFAIATDDILRRIALDHRAAGPARYRNYHLVPQLYYYNRNCCLDHRRSFGHHNIGYCRHTVDCYHSSLYSLLHGKKCPYYGLNFGNRSRASCNLDHTCCRNDFIDLLMLDNLNCINPPYSYHFLYASYHLQSYSDVHQHVMALLAGVVHYYCIHYCSKSLHSYDLLLQDYLQMSHSNICCVQQAQLHALRLLKIWYCQPIHCSTFAYKS